KGTRAVAQAISDLDVAAARIRDSRQANVKAVVIRGNRHLLIGKSGLSPVGIEHIFGGKIIDGRVRYVVWIIGITIHINHTPVLEVEIGPRGVGLRTASDQTPLHPRFEWPPDAAVRPNHRLGAGPTSAPIPPSLTVTAHLGARRGSICPCP